MILKIEDVTDDQIDTRQVAILGTPLSIINKARMLRLFERWLSDPQDRYVVFRDVHGVIAALSNVKLDVAHKHADIVATDGMPLVWALRANGVIGVSRVCGPDVLPATCEYGLSRGWRHYFYGGGPGVAETLADELVKKYPGLRVVGTQCPPFRPLTRDEDQLACAKIRDANPHFIWVGLSTPKQEIWMFKHRASWGGAIMLGIGAAFDVHAKLIPRAPIWMQKNGLEWAYRLLKEPGRLWRRYLIMAPQFVLLVAKELIQKPRRT